MTDGNDLPEQLPHIEYLELCQVWKSIGLSLDNKVLQEWKEKYPVNIAMLDSGVKEQHEAFQSQRHPQPKVIKVKSFVNENNSTNDVTGHGTFCAGVAAGYPIPSPKQTKDYKIRGCGSKFAKLLKLSDGSKGVIEDALHELTGSDSGNCQFVGVAPFANVISYKVIDDNDKVDEDALASALEDLAKCNSNVESIEEKVHIVCTSLKARYHDGVRQALYDVLNNDVIVVAAACNMGQQNNYCSGNIWFPAWFGNVISVGSHDDFGQPSKMSSVGREVDFLAPGEDVWGPSISETEEHCYIEKDEGTSISAALVSGIVALVLAFVHKEKGIEERAKISNNPVMREILVNMATKRGQHDQVMGYGSLKPLKVLGNDSRVLWNLVENLPSISPPDGPQISKFNAKVSKFILSVTSCAMYSLEDIAEIQDIKSYSVNSNYKCAMYPVNYHEDNDPNETRPSRFGCLMKSTLDALGYLKQRRLESHVKVINLILPIIPFCSSQSHLYYPYDETRKLLLCGEVLPIIKESQVQSIELLVVPEWKHIYASDLCKFLKYLLESVELKSVLIDSDIPSGVLYRVAQILDPHQVTLYVPWIKDPTYDKNEPQWCKFPQLTGVKVITSIPEGCLTNYKVPFDMQSNSSAIKVAREYGLKCDDQPKEDLSCIDEVLVRNPQSPVYAPKNYNSLVLNDAELSKVTVAILGDAINIHHNEIRGKINPESQLKCFTNPAGGTVENGRYLGTLCASIIAEVPCVDLVYATVINAQRQTKPEWVIAALEWIAGEHKEVDIVVIPLGFDEFNVNLYKTINNLSKNTVVICAASRSRPFRPMICYPAKYGDVVCVGSHSASSEPSSFSPRGREIDLLAWGEDVTFCCFSEIKREYDLVTLEEIGPDVVISTYALSGTCVSVAYVARVIVQIVSFALHCGFERKQITNNTVMREMFRHTCNFFHDSHNGHGRLTDLSESVLFKNQDYFKKVVKKILSIDDVRVDATDE